MFGEACFPLWGGPCLGLSFTLVEISWRQTTVTLVWGAGPRERLTLRESGDMRRAWDGPRDQVCKMNLNRESSSRGPRPSHRHGHAAAVSTLNQPFVFVSPARNSDEWQSCQAYLARQDPRKDRSEIQWLFHERLREELEIVFKETWTGQAGYQTVTKNQTKPN